MNAFRLRLSLLLLLLAPVFPSGCKGGSDVSDHRAGGDDVGLASVTSDISGISDISGAGDEKPNRLFATVKYDNRIYQAWHLEFRTAEDCEAFNPSYGKVFNRFQKWADVYVPSTSTNLLGLAPGLAWMDRGRALIVPPPPPPSEPVASRGTPEPIVRGGVSGLKGKGVIIAVVDSGLDFRHPDFIVPDSQGRPVSRLKYLWDTTSDAFDRKGLGGAAPIQYPNGSSVGTLYTQEQLTADLRAPQRQIPSTDAHGHGTACAGIAAGNGRALKDLNYSGVAPEADLIGVRIGGTPTTQLENSYLLGAICTWVDQVAGKQPCVISCSFGGQTGGRDGSVVIERQLDARFAPTVQGRAICIAAGNDRDKGIHAEAMTGSEEKAGVIEWQVPQGSGAEVFIYVASENVADLSLSWTSADKPTPTGARKAFHKLSKNVLFIVNTGPGTFGVKVVSASDQPAAADAYISQTMENQPMLRFNGPCLSMSKQVGTPATSLQAITVGSYDFNDHFSVKGQLVTVGPVKGGKLAPLTMGALSDYSNPGPRRTGDAVKPELTAPGEYHTAPLAQDNVTMAKGIVETSGKYVASNGTSSATPYCAGVVALMFEKNPKLTLADVKRILQGALTKDNYTGRTPNGAWGHGKLDLKAVRAAIAAVK